MFSGPGARIFFGARIFIFYLKSQQDISVPAQNIYYYIGTFLGRDGKKIPFDGRGLAEGPFLAHVLPGGIYGGAWGAVCV